MYVSALAATDSTGTKSAVAHAMAPSPVRYDARWSHLSYPAEPGNKNVWQGNQNVEPTQ